MRTIQEVLKEFCEYALANDHDVSVVFCSPSSYQYGVKISVQEWDDDEGHYVNLFEYYAACESFADCDIVTDACVKLRGKVMGY